MSLTQSFAPSARPAVGVTPVAATPTSHASAPLNWRAVAIAAAVVSAASFVLTFAKYRTRRSRVIQPVESDMPALEEMPKAASTKKATTAKSVVQRTWTQDEFHQAAGQLLANIGQQNYLDEALEAQVRQALPQVHAFSNEVRALASHFLLATNAYHLSSARSEEEFDQFMKQQIDDMKLAWKLLDCERGDETQERALDIMRLQVAQCLKDASLMLQIFDRMTRRGPVDALDDEELILLFTTAPLLGRWAMMVQLGDRLAAKHDLAGFHESPMDYGVLYELAKTEQTKGDAPLDQIQWANYKIVMQRIRMRNAECDDAEILKSLDGEFTQDGKHTWKVIPVYDALRFVRCGALSQMRSFSPLPLSLVGPSSDERIISQGYAYIQESQDALPSSKQTETYDLARVTVDDLDSSYKLEELPEGTLYWKGTYTMVQESPFTEEERAKAPSPVAAVPPLKVVFDFEMAMVVLQGQ